MRLTQFSHCKQRQVNSGALGAQCLHPRNIRSFWPMLPLQGPFSGFAQLSKPSCVGRLTAQMIILELRHYGDEENDGFRGLHAYENLPNPYPLSSFRISISCLVVFSWPEFDFDFVASSRFGVPTIGPAPSESTTLPPTSLPCVGQHFEECSPVDWNGHSPSVQMTCRYTCVTGFLHRISAPDTRTRRMSDKDPCHITCASYNICSDHVRGMVHASPIDAYHNGLESACAHFFLFRPPFRRFFPPTTTSLHPTALQRMNVLNGGLQTQALGRKLHIAGCNRMLGEQPSWQIHV